ncbi:MAG: glycosyltransferase family 4 protein [Bryobacteraceae bacterium]
MPHITKWAGYFGPFTGERLPRRLERYLVKRSRNPVLVYGPAESPPLISFLPAVMSEDELRRARDLSHGRTWEPPWKILSVGGLSDEKGFALAIRGLGRLQARSPHLRWRFTLIGDGPDASKLRELAKHSDIVDRVTFTGALSFDLAQCHYAEAHVVIMPGVQEGWPKPIPEAWAHGAVPLAAAAGIIPWILDGKQAGLTFAPTPDGLAGALHELLSNPPAMKAMASRGPRLAAELSLETFAARLERLLVDSCHLA